MYRFLWTLSVPTRSLAKRRRIVPFTLQCRIREGKSTIVTGHIDYITEDGIKMKSGRHVHADFIISATGMNLQKNLPFSTIKVGDLCSYTAKVQCPYTIISTLLAIQTSVEVYLMPCHPKCGPDGVNLFYSQIIVTLLGH